MSHNEHDFDDSKSLAEICEEQWYEDMEAMSVALFDEMQLEEQAK